MLAKEILSKHCKLLSVLVFSGFLANQSFAESNEVPPFNISFNFGASIGSGNVLHLALQGNNIFTFGDFNIGLRAGGDLFGNGYAVGLDTILTWTLQSTSPYAGFGLGLGKESAYANIFAGAFIPLTEDVSFYGETVLDFPFSKAIYLLARVGVRLTF